MFLPAFACLLALPLVSAGVHKFPLKKIQPVAANPALETAYLAQKYGGQAPMQPIMGAGGEGRRMRLARPGQDAEDLYWTQDEVSVTGGHDVPLTSAPSFIYLLVMVTYPGAKTS
jgi:saccharopepsin